MESHRITSETIVKRKGNYAVVHKDATLEYLQKLYNTSCLTFKILVSKPRLATSQKSVVLSGSSS